MKGILFVGVAGGFLKLAYDNKPALVGMFQNISASICDFCYATTTLGNPCVMIGQTAAEFSKYLFKEIQKEIHREMHQLYQVFPSTEAVLNMGIGALNNTSTFLSNACCELGKIAVDSNYKQQQAISGLLICSAGILAVAALYKLSHKNSKPSEQGRIDSAKLSTQANGNSDDLKTKEQQHDKNEREGANKQDTSPVLADPQRATKAVIKRNIHLIYPTDEGTDMYQHINEVIKARRKAVDKSLGICEASI